MASPVHDTVQHGGERRDADAAAHQHRVLGVKHAGGGRPVRTVQDYLNTHRQAGLATEQSTRKRHRGYHQCKTAGKCT